MSTEESVNTKKKNKKQENHYKKRPEGKTKEGKRKTFGEEKVKEQDLELQDKEIKKKEESERKKLQDLSEEHEGKRTGNVPLALYKDDIAEFLVTDIGNDGEGIGHADGYTLFVKDAVIGDTVRAKVMKAKKGYGYARLLDVITRSPCRVEPACRIAGPCGGCQIQALSYKEQLAFKENKVKNLLMRIGGFPEEKLKEIFHPIIGMENPYRYRNKAQVPIGKDKEGRYIAGFYAGRTHAIIPMGDCLIGRKGNDDIIGRILSWMDRYKVSAYNEATGEGIIRHVLIRNGIYSGEIMTCLVVNADKVPAEGALVDTLKEVSGMASISLSVNKEKTNVVMGKKIRLLWGKDTIRDTLHVYDVRYEADRSPCEGGIPEGSFKREEGAKESIPGAGTGQGSTNEGADTPESAAFVLPHAATGSTAVFSKEILREVSYNISPLSFYQVNPVQTEKLYSVALHFAGLTGKENVWDLYCGVGTISLFLAGSAGRVYGVEVIPSAVEDATENAKENGIRNVSFQVGKVEEVLPLYVEETKDRPDVVVVDPPRKGCDIRCLETILEVKPERVVYVSCDPATLARDLKILTEKEYELCRVQPVDMFPHSVHVECVVKLSRKP